MNSKIRLRWVISSFFIFLNMLLCSAFLFAAKGERIDIYGYFEPQFSGHSINNEFYQFSGNKLRVDLKSEQAENISFGGNVNFIQYFAKTEWNLLDFIPRSLSGTVAAAQKEFYNVSYEDEIILDNAYIKAAFKYADITIGKQQIPLGTGYLWNPTDVFNYKDLIDPTYEQPGHNAIRIDVPIKTGYSLVMLYEQESTYNDSGKLIRLKGSMGHFDYSLIGIEKNRLLTDYYTFNEINQKRKILGFDFAGEFLGLGLWGEYAYNFMENNKDFYEMTTGIDYTFVDGMHVMIEYYRNTEAKTNYKKYDLNDWLRFFTAQTKSVSRDQIYSSLNYPITDLISIGTSVAANLNDTGLALIPFLSYSVFENVELAVFLNFNLGKKGTNYDTDLGNSGIVRFRMYF